MVVLLSLLLLLLLLAEMEKQAMKKKKSMPRLQKAETLTEKSSAKLTEKLCPQKNAIGLDVKDLITAAPPATSPGGVVNISL